MGFFKYFFLGLFSLLSFSYATQQMQDQTIDRKNEIHNEFFIDGEFLYWRADQTGMTYCLVTNSVPALHGVGSILGDRSKGVHQKSGWAPGFRIGTGYILSRTSFDITAYWTRFHNSFHGSTKGPFIFATQLLSPTNGFYIGGDGVDGGGAHSKWTLDLDLVDLDFGYRLSFNNRFLLHPYIGVEAGRIYQKQKIVYHQFLDPEFNVYFSSKIGQKNNFRGLGPKFGLDGDFKLGAGFGLFGNLSTTLFYGTEQSPVRIHTEETLSIALNHYEFRYSKRKLIPLLQGQVGINWEHRWFKHFDLFIGANYEVLYFWETWRNQNSSIQNLYIQEAGYGNLMLHGLTLQAKIVF